MRLVTALLASAVLLGCAPSGGATYEDVCRTTKTLCSVADALCMFTPRMRLAPQDSLAKQMTLRRVDSLALEIQKQIHLLAEEP